MDGVNVKFSGSSNTLSLGARSGWHTWSYTLNAGIWRGLKQSRGAMGQLALTFGTTDCTTHIKFNVHDCNLAACLHVTGSKVATVAAWPEAPDPLMPLQPGLVCMAILVTQRHQLSCAALEHCGKRVAQCSRSGGVAAGKRNHCGWWEGGGGSLGVSGDACANHAHLRRSQGRASLGPRPHQTSQRGAHPRWPLPQHRVHSASITVAQGWTLLIAASERW